MDKYLKFDIEHSIQEKRIVVRMYEVTKSSHEKFMNTPRLIYCRGFGYWFANPDYGSIQRKINSIQYKMIQDCKKNAGTYKMIDSICASFSFGKIVIADAKTEHFLKRLMNGLIPKK